MSVSRGAAEVIESNQMIRGYSDILLDISALPRSLYMPMLAKLLYLNDAPEGNCRRNLHVLTSDNPTLDRLITPEGLNEDACYVHGFESGIEQESTAHLPKVWMPILGEGKVGHLERIYTLVDPDEIVPILPFPCRNPRRTDNLLLEYREFLFERVRIEPSNFMYVPEQNPFGVYREIVSAVMHYSEALAPLKGCKTVISALSSKLLSLGALLAAWDLKKSDYCVGIAHVLAEGYHLHNQSSSLDSENNLFEVWIDGEPYDTA